MLDDFYVREVQVNIINDTGTQVYLNRDFTPGGILMVKGNTFIDGSEFFIIARDATPLSVEIKGPAWGHVVTRWAQQSATKVYRLAQTGAAVGLTGMRTYDRDGKGQVTVYIKKA